MNAFTFPKVRAMHRNEHLLRELDVHRIHRLPDPDYAGDLARITIYYHAELSSWFYSAWLKRTMVGNPLIVGPGVCQRLGSEFDAQQAARNALINRARHDPEILNWLGGGGTPSFYPPPRIACCAA